MRGRVAPTSESPPVHVRRLSGRGPVRASRVRRDLPRIARSSCSPGPRVRPPTFGPASATRSSLGSSTAWRSARLEAARTMTVPKEVEQAHPHLLLVLENYQQAAEAATLGEVGALRHLPPERTRRGAHVQSRVEAARLDPCPRHPETISRVLRTRNRTRYRGSSSRTFGTLSAAAVAFAPNATVAHEIARAEARSRPRRAARRSGWDSLTCSVLRRFRRS